MHALGTHLLVELKDCQSNSLSDPDFVRTSMIDAAKKAHATIVDDKFHHFSPFGVSGVVVIAESHLAIHTWPEYRYAAVDVFTCGDTLKPEVAAIYLAQVFQSQNPSIHEIKRASSESTTIKSPTKSRERRACLDLPKTGKESNPMNGARTSKWYIEYAAPSLGHMHGIDEIIVSQQTSFQKVDILRTNVYGKALALDEKMQSTQVDEFIYHEALVHPAMLAHPSPRSVLIIGGGKGPRFAKLSDTRQLKRLSWSILTIRSLPFPENIFPNGTRAPLKILDQPCLQPMHENILRIQRTSST